jgi:hypothetical protein
VLKWYLTSPPIMVDPEPGEPLLFYIMAITKVVSMVLVAKRPEPHPPQELGSSSASGSGFQGPELTGEPRAGEATKSQLPEIYLAHDDIGSQPLGATSGPDDQTVTGPGPQRSLGIQRTGSPRRPSPWR